jgi:hypothetical protein
MEILNYLRPQPSLYYLPPTYDARLDDSLIGQDRQREFMDAYEQSEAQNTMWDRLRGYGNQLGQHMGEYGPTYALGAAPLIPAAAALGIGLYGNKQKERPKRRLG